MRYRKTIKIGTRIFTPEDVMLLASLLEKQQCQLEGRCNYEALFSDTTAITSDSVDLFSSTYFTRKDIEKINMTFYDQLSERSIRISLENERFFPDVLNDITIDSSDEEWFNAMCNSLTDIVGGIKKRHWLWIWLTAPRFIATYFAYLAVLVFVMIGPLDFQWGPNADNVAIFIHPVLFFLLSVLVFGGIVALAHWLYPPVEFTYNAPKYRRRLRLRKAWGWLFSTLLIPIVLSLLI